MHIASKRDRFMILCYCSSASFILLALNTSRLYAFPLSPAAAARVLGAHVFGKKLKLVRIKKAPARPKIGS